jgi:threonine dehydratase
MLALEKVLKAKTNFDKNIIRHTPLEFDQHLSEKYDANIYLKREDLQIVRSYKIR